MTYRKKLGEKEGPLELAWGRGKGVSRAFPTVERDGYRGSKGPSSSIYGEAPRIVGRPSFKRGSGGG